MKEERIEIPGFSIAGKSLGTKGSRPILCLHGMMDNAASFDLLAPLLPNAYVLAIDFPGTGLSSHYPANILPNCKNDALLMLEVVKTLKWESFDIIAHSLGSLTATMMAISDQCLINRMVFLDILGPKRDFTKKIAEYRVRDIANFLSYGEKAHTVFPDLESAIKDRMSLARISYQGAKALTVRGTHKVVGGIGWGFDQRLRSVSLTLPYEDELMSMFREVKQPICFIRAKDGVTYDEEVLKKRALAIKSLTTIEIEGGHHVHMDDPKIVADIITGFLNLSG